MHIPVTAYTVCLHVENDSVLLLPGLWPVLICNNLHVAYVCPLKVYQACFFSMTSEQMFVA